MSALPAGACTFWQRAELREIDAHGFGYRPTLSDDECAAAAEREETEDEKDPACGTCACCIESAAELVADPDFSAAMSLDLCSVCRKPTHASESDELGRCETCAAKAGQPHAKPAEAGHIAKHNGIPIPLGHRAFLIEQLPDESATTWPADLDQMPESDLAVLARVRAKVAALPRKVGAVSLRKEERETLWAWAYNCLSNRPDPVGAYTTLRERLWYEPIDRAARTAAKAPA